MSFGNAIRQREEMITEYERILKFETDPLRIADINNKILQCQDEIAELKKGKPLFGRAKPLKQTTTIIEPDRENPGQIVRRIVNPPSPNNSKSMVDSESPKTSPVPIEGEDKPAKKTHRLENKLRSQIQAAKAAKAKKDN